MIRYTVKADTESKSTYINLILKNLVFKQIDDAIDKLKRSVFFSRLILHKNYVNQ